MTLPPRGGIIADMSKHEMQRIECKHEGDLTIGLATPVGDTGRKKPGALRLSNGENKVDGELWALAKEQGVVKRYLDAGVLIDKGTVPMDYTSIPERDAVEMARETMDERKIAGWLKEETRPAVRAALMEQHERFLAVRTGGAADDAGGRPVGAPGAPTAPSRPTAPTRTPK